MVASIKKLIKKNVPARYLEMISHKAVAITKIPKQNSVISDLFLFRTEDEWKPILNALS